MEPEAMSIVIEDMEVDNHEPNPLEPEVPQLPPRPEPTRAPADKRSGTRKRKTSTRQQDQGDETEPAAKRTRSSPQACDKDNTRTQHTLKTRDKAEHASEIETQ